MDAFKKMMRDFVAGKADAVDPPAQDPVMPPAGSGAAGQGQRSNLGKRILLGHPVTRTRNGPWKVGPHDSALTAPTRSHAVTIGAAGVGKASSLGIPNLLSWDGSAIVLDVKGELSWCTADFRRRVLGQEVYIFDPTGMVEQLYWQQAERRWPGRYARDETVLPVKCNPIGRLDPADPMFDVDSTGLAAAFCPTRPTDQPFFDDRAQQLINAALTAICSGTFVAEHASGRRFGYARDLSALSALLQMSPKMLAATLDYAREKNPLVAARLAQFTLTSDSVTDTFATASGATWRWLDNRLVQQAMTPMPGDRTLDLSIVRDPKRKFTIFLVFPGFGESVFGPLLRVMLQRLLAEAQRTLRDDDNKILVLLDEIGNIPDGVPILPSIYGRARGAGLCVWSMFQTLGQIRRHYGESFADFEGNSSVLQFLGTADHQTAQYLAAKIARHERQQTSTSWSTTSSQQGASSSRNTTTSWVTEAAMDAGEVEQAAQRVIGNFMFGEGRGGRLYWSAAMDYWATPMFNNLWRPLPNKPLAPPAGPRPAMGVDRFIQWREANRS